MGMLAAYCYFFEPYYPEAFDPHVIESIFKFFPLHKDENGWDSKNPVYTSRRV